jgi:hypothetical protein
MVPFCGVILRSDIDEHVIVIDWSFSEERGRMTILLLRIEQTWKITVMPDDIALNKVLLMFIRRTSAHTNVFLDKDVVEMLV